MNSQLLSKLQRRRNHRNNDKEIEFDVEMIHLPEISTFNHDKEGEPGAKLEFNIVIKNSASGTIHST